MFLQSFDLNPLNSKYSVIYGHGLPLQVLVKDVEVEAACKVDTTAEVDALVFVAFEAVEDMPKPEVTFTEDAVVTETFLNLSSSKQANEDYATAPTGNESSVKTVTVIDGSNADGLTAAGLDGVFL